MHRPRRTSEISLDHQTPNTNPKFGNRPSRIAAPLWRTSTRERSTDRASSVDGGSGNNKYLSSTTKRQRSNSACITPQRTPTHQMVYTASKVPMTAEKQRAPLTDKKWQQEQSVKIVDYLKSTDILGKDFFCRGNGLKTISTKNFVVITNHLLKFISGNRYKVGTNHADELPKILENLNYPYMVAKSWLKTPSAPHSIGNVILLFNWLLSFNPELYNDESFQQEFQLMNNEFPNFDYEKDFHRMTRESFDLWNNQKNDEYEMMKRISIDKFIESKIGLVGGIVIIDDELKQLNKELEILNKNKIIIENEDALNQLKNEINTKRKEFETQEKLYASYEQRLNELRKRDAIDKQQVKDLKQMNGQIENMIKEQKYSVELHKQLIVEVDQLNHFVSTKTKSIKELEKKGDIIQIQLSRIIKEKTVAIAKFNNFIRELFTICHSGLINEYSMDGMLLNAENKNELNQQINDISSMLQQIFHKNSKIIEHYTTEIAEMENQLKNVLYENENALKPKSIEMKNVSTDIKEMLENLNHKINETKTNNNAKLEKLLTDLSLIRDDNINLEFQLKQTQNDINDGYNLNKSMLARFDEKMIEVQNIRTQLQKDLDTAIENLSKALENHKMKRSQKDWEQFEL